MQSFAKILLMQTAFIGDVILITPLIRAIKERFPSSRLSVLLIPSTEEILTNNPSVDEILVYDKRESEKGLRNLCRLINDLRKRRFDLAIVPHRSLRSALIAKSSCISRRIGFRTRLGRFLFTDRVNYQKGVHEIERNGALLEPLGVSFHVGPPELFPSSVDIAVAEELLRSEGSAPSQQVVGISPGSVWPTKRWPWDRFALVADRLISKHGMGVVLFGSTRDRELCLKISQRMSRRPVVAAGRLSILQSAALMQRCRVLLSNDSAPVHMAVAMGTPVVAIFGATTPDLGFAPFGAKNTVIQRPMSCRPCGPHGGRRCRRGTFACMKLIQVDEVLAAVVEKL